jgi:hypothetical protein
MTAASPQGPMPDLIDLKEFFADPEFAVPTISADGTRIAYLAPAHGRRNVWVRDDAPAPACLWVRRPAR